MIKVKVGEEDSYGNEYPENIFLLDEDTGNKMDVAGWDDGSIYIRILDKEDSLLFQDTLANDKNLASQVAEMIYAYTIAKMKKDA